MIRLVPDSFKLNLLSQWQMFVIGSAVLMLATVGLLIFRGLNFGIDFTGGALVQIQTEQAESIADIRSQLQVAGFEGLTIQEYGAANEFLIRAPGGGDTVNSLGADISKALGSGTQVRRVEFVGPQVGKELREKGALGILFALVAILAYISLRFELRYGVGALVALFHDVWLTLGLFSLIWHEISLPVLAAVLTIIGYSLNDTIVVFDRVRENRNRYRKKPLKDILNISLNEMMSRTLMTSLTTLVALLALYALGGEVIQDFALALLFGVVVGTYSSIFIASPVLLLMERYYKNRPTTGVENNPSSIGQ